VGVNRERGPVKKKGRGGDHPGLSFPARHGTGRLGIRAMKTITK